MAEPKRQRTIATLGLVATIAATVLVLVLRASGTDTNDDTQSPPSTASAEESAEVSTAPAVDGDPDGSPTEAVPAPCIEIEAPASDLAAVVSNAPEGACFELAVGTYDFFSVKPKNGMSFTGVDRDQVIVDGSGHETAFFGEAADVTISTMTLRNFDDPAGTFPQPQAPIRGSTMLWPPADGTGLASGWYIENIVAHGNVASGVVVGHGFTVVDSEFYDNGVNGISGGNFNGALIARNTIYGNGADAASGQGANGGGIKLAHNLGDQPVMITDNVVYDNNMTGIWCDLQCNNVTISNNTVSDQPDHGILYEISSDGLIENNTIVNSGSDTRWGKDWSGGCITVAESERVVVTGNTLRHCDGAIVLQQTPRPQSHETWLAERYADGSVTTDRLANITVTGNEIVDSNGFGISEAPGSDGQVDYDSIVFESNTITQGIGFPHDTLFWSKGVSTPAS